MARPGPLLRGRREAHARNPGGLCSQTGRRQTRQRRQNHARRFAADLRRPAGRRGSYGRSGEAPGIARSTAGPDRGTAVFWGAQRGGSRRGHADFHPHRETRMAIGQGLAASGVDAGKRPMTPERWKEVKRLFDAVLERQPADRQEFLEATCGGDAILRAEVTSLLDALAGAGSRYEIPAVAPDPLLDRQFGPYRILRRLGAGGMGAVYLAARADDQFRRLVAVKAILPELLDEHTRRRFENERHTLAALEHPNIVRRSEEHTSEL